VFRPDAALHFRRLTAACDKLGMEALAPFDESVTPATKPHAIYAANMAMLKSAQGVIANLAPFRGTEPDSGTVFEVGVAAALGLPVVAYGTPQGSYADCVSTCMRVERAADGALRDPAGHQVEDFGLPLNLMLSGSVTFATTAEEALTRIAALLAP
jgi:nucleoside 2-deoxyribosyltransferase